MLDCVQMEEVARRYFPGADAALSGPLLYSSWLSKVTSQMGKHPCAIIIVVVRDGRGWFEYYKVPCESCRANLLEVV